MSGGGSPWVAGVDGCRGGWVAVLRDRRRGQVRARVLPDFAAALALPEAPSVVAVDMPIGLAEEARPGGRPCERGVRALLGPRRASVFSPPTRGALAAFRAGAGHAEVSRANRGGDAGAPGLTLQAFLILPKIDEVERALAARRRGGPVVVEAHPELSFAEANGARPMRHGKKSAAGRRERLRVLARLGFAAPLELLGARRPGGVGPDDLLDACIVAWTAARVAAGTAIAIPELPAVVGSGPRAGVWR